MLTAVHIPNAPDPVDDETLRALDPKEIEYARTLRGYRQVQFVGGRIALHQAASQIVGRHGPILPDDRGAPRMPKGLIGSASHKSDLAIGMVRRADGRSLGVDLEDYSPARMGIVSHVLTPAEQNDIESLPEDRRWIEVLLRFSIKESIYKAIDPFVRRYVGFDEAEVTLDLQGKADVKLHLKNGEGPFDVQARYEWLFGRIVTSVRIGHASSLPKEGVSP